MSQKYRNFIHIIHGKNRENHKVIINERAFNFNDVRKWKLYLKLILQHINYLYEINNKDIHPLLQDVINQINLEAQQFKRKMGYLLGDWRY